MKFLKSLFYAFRGTVSCICDQRNMRIHIVVAAYVLYFSQFYPLSTESICILWLVIGVVLALELLNTAIEKTCDAVTMEKSELIKIAKDASAGAVLTVAVVSVIIGVRLFFDMKTVWKIISFLCNTPEYLTVFILSMLVSIVFIVVGPNKLVENIKERSELRQQLDNMDDKKNA